MIRLFTDSRRLPTKYLLARSTSKLKVSLYGGEGNQSETIHRSKTLVGLPDVRYFGFLGVGDAIGGCAKSAVFWLQDAPATAERILMTTKSIKRYENQPISR